MSGAKLVLLVDDDDDFLSLVAPALEGRGHTVLVARTGASAASIVDSRHVDVMVVDGLLPDVDGISWLSERRARSSETSVVFVSAFWGFIEALTRLKDALGVACVLHKPVDASAFCAEVERCATDRSAPAPVAPPGTDARALDPVRAHYAGVLPARLSEIARYVSRAKRDPGSVFLRSELRSRAHRLRGTAGSYGFVGLGNAAGRIEDALDATVDPSTRAHAWAQIEAALADAARHVDSAIGRPPETGTAPRGTPVGVGGARLLVVADDPLLLRCLDELAGRHFFEIDHATRVTAVECASTSRPDAVLVEIPTAGATTRLDLPRRLRRLAGLDRLPVAFVSPTDDARARAIAAGAGASLYLTKPVEPTSLGLALRDLVAAGRRSSSRVLAVTTDRASSAACCALRTSGKTVVELHDPAGIVESLRDVRPDLVLLDGLGASASIDLCRVVRTDAEWQDLPVVVVGATDAPRVALLRAGADDQLTEPVDRDELLARVDARLDRRRMLHNRFDLDALTDLPLRHPFLERLTRAMAENLRHERPLTLALLDVDLFKRLNDTHGHAAGDRALATLGRLLAARFRVEDIRGRWGGDEFVVAFPGESAAALHDVITGVSSEFAAIAFRAPRGETFHLTFSAGTASHPTDGSSIQVLLEVADRRLYLAKRTGRGRVVSSG